MSYLKTADIPKLTGPDNYTLWRTLISDHLVIASPDFMHNPYARYIILTTVDPAIAKYLATFPTARAMFDAIEAMYSRPHIASRGKIYLQCMNTMNYKSFDTFMWEYMSNFHQMRTEKVEVSDEEAMIIPMNKIKRYIIYYQEQQVFRTVCSEIGKDTGEYRTLEQLVGWIVSTHRSSISDQMARGY